MTGKEEGGKGNQKIKQKSNQKTRKLQKKRNKQMVRQ